MVLAADAPDADVVVRDDLDPRGRASAAAVPLVAVAPVHVDDADAEAAVGAGARAVIAADLGDQGSQDAVDDVEGFELAWFATQEIAALLDDLG